MASMYSIVLGLSLFIAFLSFKPSEPYLSQYLICNQRTADESCGATSQSSCTAKGVICEWSSSTTSSCSPIPCSNVSISLCGNSDFYYCEKKDNQCQATKCYENFSENQVNNEIYPWSTYAYFPFLLLLGPFAELYSYRFAILFGILGRVVTRAVLLFGKTLLEMQLTQVAFSLGTAAEDVFSAYIYYVVKAEDYQFATSTIKAAALLSCLVSGVLGDILVVEFQASLTVLTWISAVFVWAGFLVGLFVIRPATDTKTQSQSVLTQLDDVEMDTSRTQRQHIPLEEEQLSSKLSKMHIFLHQLRCLRIAMKSPVVKCMLGLWVIGNAIFQILYNYEASIFQELQGQDSSWNGSALAAMLVAGSIGAMIPAMETDPCTWLLRLVFRSRNTTIPTNWSADNRTTVDNRNSIRMTSRLMIASVVAIVTLIGFVMTWDIVRSVTCLAGFFATWQYINVIVYAEFATYLKEAEQLQRNQNDYTTLLLTEDKQFHHHSDNANNGNHALETVDPPYSLAIVMIIAANVLVQIILQALFFSILGMSLYTACVNMLWIFIATVASYTLLTFYHFGFLVYWESWRTWWTTL